MASSKDLAQERARWHEFKHDCFFTPLNCRLRRPVLPSWMRMQRAKEEEQEEVPSASALIDEIDDRQKQQQQQQMEELGKQKPIWRPRKGTRRRPRPLKRQRDYSNSMRRLW